MKTLVYLAIVASAFFFGLNYGKKAFHDSEDYKALVKANEELADEKAELEKTKTKLQNLINSSDTKKTDELLAQILQVFLADLGLRVKNKEVVLQQLPESIVQPTQQPLPIPVVVKEKSSEISVKKRIDLEYKLRETDGGLSTLKGLEKVLIVNLNSYLKTQLFSDNVTYCSAFLGVYSGKVVSMDKKKLGSLEFEFKARPTEYGEFYGNIAWQDDAKKKKLKQSIGDNCGKRVSVQILAGNIFHLSATWFVQIFKLSNQEEIAGNLYENSPDGGVARIGYFILDRADKP